MKGRGCGFMIIAESRLGDKSFARDREEYFIMMKGSFTRNLKQF